MLVQNKSSVDPRRKTTNKYVYSTEKRNIWGFLKWWYPTTMGFPTKNDHFGVLWGYHHLRKHPYQYTHRQLIENKHSVFDYWNGQYHKSSLEKTKGNDILSRIRGKQLRFVYVLSVVSSSKCGLNRHRP